MIPVMCESDYLGSVDDIKVQRILGTIPEGRGNELMTGQYLIIG